MDPPCILDLCFLVGCLLPRAYRESPPRLETGLAGGLGGFFFFLFFFFFFLAGLVALRRPPCLGVPGGGNTDQDVEEVGTLWRHTVS